MMFGGFRGWVLPPALDAYRIFSDLYVVTEQNKCSAKQPMQMTMHQSLKIIRNL